MFSKKPLLYPRQHASSWEIKVKKQKHRPWPHGAYLNNEHELFTKLSWTLKFSIDTQMI